MIETIIHWVTGTVTVISHIRARHYQHPFAERVAARLSRLFIYKGTLLPVPTSPPLTHMRNDLELRLGRTAGLYLVGKFQYVN
jgi:hypothetical protein